jgi:hypothetical protein
MSLRKFFVATIFMATFDSNVIAAPSDCDGECSHNHFERDVLPNQRPAVALQEELENIARKRGISRSPAVVPEEPEEESAGVCKTDFIYSKYKETLVCP